MRHRRITCRFGYGAFNFLVACVAIDFGSIVNGKFDENSDIDIAVRGLEDKYYFKVLGEFGMKLFHEVDLLDLDDEENRFAQFILKKRELIKVA